MFGSVEDHPDSETAFKPVDVVHRPLVEGAVAHAFCVGCGRPFQVSAERAQAMLGSRALPGGGEYIELDGCSACCRVDFVGVRVKHKPDA